MIEHYNLFTKFIVFELNIPIRIFKDFKKNAQSSNK